MTINVVLDIDGVLACTSVFNIQQAKVFKNKGAILSAIKTHYIFPGVIEFVKLLFQTENVKVSFFSSGDKKRNKIFVDQLLKIALPESKYEEIRSKVYVLSNDDLTKSTDIEEYQRYNLPFGKNQKDISKVLGENDLLENAVLIDDSPSIVACGQAKNLLHVQTSDYVNFDLTFKYDSYQPDGYKFLRCVLAAEESSRPEKKQVKKGGQILILKTEGGFEIGFLNKFGEYQREIIPQIEHEDLLFELNKKHQNNTEKNKTVSIIKDIELIKKICNLVASFDGQMKKICRRANRICYAAGLLFTAIEEMKSKNISISESLFRKQFKLKKGMDTYEPNFQKSRKFDDLYLMGAEKLKEINSNFQLMTPHDYLECVKMPISEEDLLMLQQAIRN